MRPLENTDIKEIIKTIHYLGSTLGEETVYRDWCRMFALSIANSVVPKDCDLWKQREEQYLETIKKYSKDDAVKFSEMCAHLTLAFERDPFQDYLGCIYMELFDGQKKLGQCFTPMNVCKVCAELSLQDPEDVENLPVLIGDECSGGAALAIAACGVYQKRGVKWQRDVKFILGDVDSLCVHMSYIQMSLIGARAEVWHRNAITRECFGFIKFSTPMEILHLSL